MPTALSPFSGFYQLAYVTTDIDRALDVFATRYQVPKWVELRDMVIEIQPGRTGRIHAALAFVGPTQLELIQPLDGLVGIYQEPLPTQGFGLRFHHVAQLIQSEAEFDRQRERLHAEGIPLPIDGQAPGGVRYFYTDHRATLGHYIEHLYFSPANPDAGAVKFGIPQN
jgi:hypothetical protein